MVGALDLNVATRHLCLRVISRLNDVPELLLGSQLIESRLFHQSHKNSHHSGLFVRLRVALEVRSAAGVGVGLGKLHVLCHGIGWSHQVGHRVLWKLDELRELKDVVSFYV